MDPTFDLWCTCKKDQIRYVAVSSPVGAALGGVDQLIAEALGDGLNVPEGGLPGAGAE